MGLVTEADLDALVTAGCGVCAASSLVFRAFLDGKVPLLGGEPVGKPTWVYDGERFVDGIFEVRCSGCERVIFSADLCPRCHAEGGLGRALAEANSFGPPTSCPGCESEEVGLVGFFPARVTHAGGRAESPRTSTEIHDPGFHAFRVDCVDCGVVDEVVDRCPLCSRPGPLRARPS